MSGKPVRLDKHRGLPASPEIHDGSQLDAGSCDGPLSEIPLDTDGPHLATTEVAGDAHGLVEVRHRLAEWAASVEFDGRDIDDLVLATYEALTNAVEHAYSDGPRPVELVAATTADGGVLVTVRDHGRWRAPAADSGFRGRGLRMMEALADRYEIERGSEGTTVRMLWQGQR